jgi:uncharacterized membrane protein YvbJ
MEKCPSCNAYNDEKSKFCKSCGYKLPLRTVCPHCSREIKPENNFCKYCGKSLKSYKPGKTLNDLLKNTIFNSGWIKSIFLKKDPLILSLMALVLLSVLAIIIVSTILLYNNLSTQNDTQSAILSFGEITICDNIDDETYAPLTQNVEFKIGFREIYATIHISGVSSEDYFTYRWRYADSGEVIREFSFDYFIEEGYIPDYFIIPEGDDIADYYIFSEPGSYIVDFFHNGQYVGGASFSVVN